MAFNVFGDPITNATLEGMPKYVGKTITRKDRATVALSMKNAQEKDFNARQYVEKLKERWGTEVSTLCLVYNATGDTVTIVAYHDWDGHIGPAPYPIMIANGQWGGYLHVKTPGTATGSTAAVVYRGKNEVEDDCDWMLSWFNPGERNIYNNKAYTEIRKAGHYDKDKERWGVWDQVSDKLNKSGLNHNDTEQGCLSNVITGCGNSPIFEGIMTLP